MRLLALVLSAFVALLASAQGHTYGLRHFGTAEGLPDRLVRGITQDDDGFIWLATPAGAVRFDGVRFDTFSSADGLSSNDVTHIVRGPDGLLWVAFGSGTEMRSISGIDLLDPRTRSVRSFGARFGKDAPCAAKEITSITTDSTGALVLSTVQGDVLRYTGGQRFQRIHPNDAVGSRHWLPAAKGYAGVLDGKGGGDTLRLMDRQGRTLEDIVLDGQVQTMRGGATERYGIRYFVRHPDGRCMEYWLAPDARFHALGEVHMADLWIKGLRLPLASGVMLADAKVRKMDMGDGVPGSSVLFDLSLEFPAIDATVHSVFRGRSGHVWLGTDFGVYELTVARSPFQQILHRQHTVHGYGTRIRSTCVENDILYVNSEMEGAYMLDAHSGEILRCDTSRVLRYGLAVDDDGSLWSWENGTIVQKRSQDLRTVRRYSMAPYHDYVWSLLRLDAKHWLLGSDNGLVVLNSATGRTGPFGPSAMLQGLDTTRVEYLGKDRHDRIWACTLNGLYRLGDSTVQEHWCVQDAAHHLPVNHVLHFYEDGQGFFWLATKSGGLVRIDLARGSTRSFGMAHGLPSNTVYAVQGDDAGLLWASTDHGLVRFDPKTGKCVTYTTGDGISQDEFNRTAHAQGPDGRMYFGGLNGITAFYPNDLNALDKPLKAPLVISAFHQYEAASDSLVDRTVEVMRTKHITMRPGDRFFQISMALLSYTVPASISYGWRIGRDAAWNDQHDPELIIGQLPYGEHVLQLRASAANGKWVPQQLDLSISVLAPFYLRWWFLLLAALLIAGGVVALFRYRLAQAHKVFAVRDRIAADLHDEIGSTLSSVALYGAVARQQSVDPSSVDLLDRITEGTSAALESMNDIVWSVNSRFDGVEHLFDRMRDFAVRTAEDSDFELRFTIEGALDAVKLDMEQRKNLYLFLREAVHNVAKHANCSNLSVTINCSRHQLRLSIADDGKGMQQGSEVAAYSMGGNGLPGMRKRAEALHGSMAVTSAPGEGTEVVLHTRL